MQASIPPVSSMISLLDFLFLLGAGVPESGIVEADPAWVGWEELKDGQGIGRVSVSVRWYCLTWNTIALDFQRNMYSLQQ